MANHRIVLIDAHIIVQFQDDIGWWTMSKAFNNDESDFAVWPLSDMNMNAARKLAGDNAPLIETDLKPIERHQDCWYISDEDQNAKPYNIALRQIARSL